VDMKILLSAYACEPNRGSEPGVGWHWALEIARLGHEVWVLTRANNRTVIATELDGMEAAPNLHFLYYDLPNWAKWWKKSSRGVRTYYVLWQWGAYRMARAEHARLNFDRVHHITFVSIRLPSFMGNLGPEFIFGPLGGGERAPWKLRRGFGWRSWILDALRDALNWLVRFDPLMRRAFAQAQAVYVTSAQSRTVIPHRWQSKTHSHLAVGFESRRWPIASRSVQCDELRLLFVGQFRAFKGMHLGISALVRASTRGGGARLTMVGKGPEEQRWRKLADRIGADDLITWKPWVAQSELTVLYQQHDALLYPSLHDSGGMVVLEAMAHGLPVICLDLGGPGIMVDADCGRVIATAGRTEAQVVEDLAAALKVLHNDDSLRARLSEGARCRAAEFSWDRQVRAIYDPGSAERATL